MSERTSMAVIGAGPAGLAAAWRLAGSGSGGDSVVVYEARSRPGGRLWTETLAGSSADMVVQLLSDGYVRTVELLESMGLADRLVSVPGRDAIRRNGRAHSLRYGSVASMATSGAIPTRLKLRLGLRYVPFLDHHADVLDLNEPSRAWELDGESIAEWGRRELGDDFVEFMAYPLLAAYYGVTPEETSAAFFHALARAGLHVAVLGVRGGFGALAGAMTEALTNSGVQVRLETPVESIHADGAGVTLTTARGEVRHDAVVVAVPPPAAARLVPGMTWLGEVRSRSTAMLALAVDGPLDTGWFGLSIPRREPPGDVLAAVCVQSAKATGLEDGGDAVVAIPAPAVSDEWAAAEDGAVVERVMPALERVLPGIGARVRETRVIRLENQVLVPSPGHFRRLRDRAEGAGGAGAGGGADGLPSGAPANGPVIGHAAGAGRVVLAGDYLVAPTVEGAVRSGWTAAARLNPGAG